MESSPQFIKTFSDEQVIHDPAQLALPEGYEKSLRAARAQSESTFGAAGVDQIINAYANTQGNKLSVEELNKRYGVFEDDGTPIVTFDKPLTAAAAENIRDRMLLSKARAEVINQMDTDTGFFDSLTNLGADLTGAVLLDPVTYTPWGWAAKGVAGAARGTKAYLAAKTALQASKGTKVAIAGLDKVADVLTNPVAFGTEARTAAVRTIGEAGFTQGVTEPLIYKNARDNDYDYDVLNAVMYGTAATLGAGALSFLGVKYLGKKGPSESGNFLQKQIEDGNLSENTVNALSNKMFTDIMENRIPDPKLTQFAQKVDYENMVRGKFFNEMEGGRFDKVLPEEIKVSLKDNLTAAQTKPIRFATWVSEQVDTIGNPVRFIDDIDTVYKRLDVTTKSIGGIDTALKNIAKNTTELNTKIDLVNRQLEELANSKLKGKDKKIAQKMTEREGLLKQLQDLNERTVEGDNLKRLLLSDEMQRNFDEMANVRKVDDMTFDEFKSEFKDLKNKLKGKKVNDIKRYPNMHLDTKKDIARLFYLANTDDITALGLKDIYKLDEDALNSAYLRHQYEKELGQMDYKQAVDYMKQRALDPDIDYKQALDDSHKAVESNPLTQGEIDYKSEADFLQQQVLNIDDAELRKQIDNLESEIIVENNFNEGLKELINCGLR